MKGPNWDSGHTATSDATMADGVSARGRGRGSIAFGRGDDDRGDGGARVEGIENSCSSSVAISVP